VELRVRFQLRDAEVSPKHEGASSCTSRLRGSNEPGRDALGQWKVVKVETMRRSSRQDARPNAEPPRTNFFLQSQTRAIMAVLWIRKNLKHRDTEAQRRPGKRRGVGTRLRSSHPLLPLFLSVPLCLCVSISGTGGLTAPRSPRRSLAASSPAPVSCLQLATDLQRSRALPLPGRLRCATRNRRKLRAFFESLGSRRRRH
jgi:hypothetical protein